MALFVVVAARKQFLDAKNRGSFERPTYAEEATTSQSIQGSWISWKQSHAGPFMPSMADSFE